MADPEIIKSHPIEDRLQAFHSQFKSICDELGVSASADSVQRVLNDNTGAKDLIVTLLPTLLTLPASRHLRSRDGSRLLFGDICALMPQFASDKSELKLLIPLLEKVADKAPDTEIWNAVYELVTPSTPTTNKNLASHTRTPSQTSGILRALQRDWNNPYFPHSLVALRDLGRQYHLFDVNEYYAKTLVFVQSSGMGKSRLADALSQHCPMIGFILREPGTSGFPPPDEEVLTFLRSDPPSYIPGPVGGEQSGDFLKKRETVAWNHTLATALLQASFETFNIWVESKPFSEMTLEGLAIARHAEMAPLQPEAHAENAKSQRSKMRIEFCKSVAERALVIAKDLISRQAWVEKFDDDGPSKVHRQLEKVYSDKYLDPLYDLRTAAENLTNNLQRCQSLSEADALLIIVFDEASSLMRKQPSAEPHTGLYVALNRIVSCLKEYRMWSFFLSTESLVGHLVPPTDATPTGDYLRDPSARLPFDEDVTQLKRFPPFVALQLDVEDRRRMQDRELKKKELEKPLQTFATLEHMALFGRPLWYAYADRSEDMIKLAKLKLLGGQKGAQYTPDDPDHVFAALSFRLSLDVCLQNPSTVSLTRTAVNSFMRVVISMDQETGMMDTLTPSEPVLARAAMEHLCNNTNNWPDSIRTLSKELLEKGLIEKGRKGELYARLLLILAHDWVRWAQHLRPDRNPVFKPFFTVSDFLMALYAEDHHPSIWQISPQILEARMNFTHFVPAYEGLTPEVIPALCRDLMRRSAAMQLSSNQVTYDLLIPVYYGKEDEKFDLSNCGVILVQVKNQVEATTPQSIFKEDFIKVSPETSDPNTERKAKGSKRKPEKFVFTKMANPILVLLLDLGVVRTKNATSPLVQVLRSDSGQQPDLWAIHSRGNDDRTFGCIRHMDARDSCKRFFGVVKMRETLADQLCLRNRTFYQLRESFRYEEEDVGEAGEESGMVDIGAQEGEASNTRSKEAELSLPLRQGTGPKS